MEEFKALEEEGMLWLTDLLNNMMNEETILEEWRESTIISICKQKGDIMNWENYHGIKLTEHGLNILERIIDKRLREIVDIKGWQNGFRKRMGTSDAIFIVKQLMEKYIKGHKDLCLTFVDLEKTYDRLSREVLFWAMRRKGVPEKLIKIVIKMYK